MAEKKKRGSLSLERRIQVIKESEKGTSHRNLALQFNCGKTQIATILLQKDELLREWEMVGKRDCFLKRKTPIGRVFNKLVWSDASLKDLGRLKTVNDLSWPTAKINNLVWAWLRDANARCIPISGPIIKAKAAEYANGLNILSFSADDEWLDSFRKRHNIISMTAYGGSGSLDSNVVVEWNIQALPTVEEYDPKNIYNVDETGLFFRELPGKALFKKANECTGGNFAKERFTICLCCNAVGDKEPLLVVSNSLRPKCLNGVDVSTLGIQWQMNGRAWMTANIFQEWLENLNKKMIRQNRKILLFMDRTSCHTNNLSLSNIELQFISADSPIFLQPLEEGITQSFKILYRKKLMKNILARSIDQEQVTTKNVNLSSVIKWMNSAWHEVKPETISKCFMMCGIAGKMSHVNIMWETNEIGELNDLCKAAGIFETILDEKIQCSNDGQGQNPEENILNTSSTRNMIGLGMMEEFEEINTESTAVPYSLHDSLIAIDSLRAMFENMNLEGAYSHVYDSLQLIEQAIEEIIIKDKISHFLASCE